MCSPSAVIKPSVPRAACEALLNLILPGEACRVDDGRQSQVRLISDGDLQERKNGKKKKKRADGEIIDSLVSSEHLILIKLQSVSYPRGSSALAR